MSHISIQEVTHTIELGHTIEEDDGEENTQEITNERSNVDRQIEHFQNMINRKVDRDQKSKEDNDKR
eukprot:10996208-Heterocapsa_arctica.AAC.1